mmetsp:Transcript_18560/g.51664  ORF Transcript_18560/g.51664 Transcript_18560/m.51664 type:complete len:275 (-) Transcript_18560:1035-1859(-)
MSSQPSLPRYPDFCNCKTITRKARATGTREHNCKLRKRTCSPRGGLHQPWVQPRIKASIVASISSSSFADTLSSLRLFSPASLSATLVSGACASPSISAPISPNVSASKASASSSLGASTDPVLCVLPKLPSSSASAHASASNSDAFSPSAALQSVLFSSKSLGLPLFLTLVRGLPLGPLASFARLQYGVSTARRVSPLGKERSVDSTSPMCVGDKRVEGASNSSLEGLDKAPTSVDPSLASLLCSCALRFFGFSGLTGAVSLRNLEPRDFSGS